MLDGSRFEPNGHSLEEQSIISHTQLIEIADYVKQYLHDSCKVSEQDWVKTFPRSADHRWQHTLNVLANAEQILEGEGADDYAAGVVRSAALLHDISMFTCDHAVHGQISADIAKDYLRKMDYDESFVQAVILAVAEHGTDLGDIPPEEQGEQFSWAGKVLIEADILDKLGASAVTSALMYLGEQKKLNFEAHGELLESSAFFRATFFKDYVWTETGKKMADRRYAFFKEYLTRLKEEVFEMGKPR